MSNLKPDERIKLSSSSLDDFFLHDNLQEVLKQMVLGIN